MKNDWVTTTENIGRLWAAGICAAFIWAIAADTLRDIDVEHDRAIAACAVPYRPDRVRVGVAHGVPDSHDANGPGRAAP